MYTDSPGLTQLSAAPFADTVDPRFFFRTRQHENALNRLLYTVRNHRALALLHGESGTGKTLISQQLLMELRNTLYCPVLVLAYPGMTRRSLLKQICSDLNIHVEGRYTTDCLHALERWVIENHEEGTRLVVIVDEAHFLTSDALHLLRTISNLETPTKKLVTTLLFAESFILRRLAHPSYASLRGRIAQEVVLGALSEEETEQYVKFRLLVSGLSPHTFTPEALRAIHEVSGGLPREISKAADNALLEIEGENRATIDADCVLAAKGGGLCA